MELIRSIHNLRPKHAGCVATIGKFDGVHLGHKQILMQLKAKSKAFGLPSLVILFEPHPSEFFSAQNAPARLNSLATKLTYLAQEGVDRVLCLAFNDALSAMSADAFIDDVLAVKLAVKHFVVGDDFRFGKGRQGSFSLLQERGALLGFSVESTLTYQLDGVRVSSTKLRQALAVHDFDLAYALADRAYAITGRVMHGQKLARTFGVPTANVKTTKYNQPLKGVYAVLITTTSSQVFQGVANIANFLVQIHFLPCFKHCWFAVSEITTHGKCSIWQIQCLLIITHFSFPYPLLVCHTAKIVFGRIYII